MSAIFTTATLGTDGMLHVPVPGSKPGAQFDVTLQIKDVPQNLSLLKKNGLEDLIGSLDDDGFRRPDQGTLPPSVPFE